VAEEETLVAAATGMKMTNVRTTMAAVVTVAMMTTMTTTKAAAAMTKPKLMTHRQQSTKSGSGRNVDSGDGDRDDKDNDCGGGSNRGNDDYNDNDGRQGWPEGKGCRQWQHGVGQASGSQRRRQQNFYLVKLLKRFIFICTLQQSPVTSIFLALSWLFVILYLQVSDEPATVHTNAGVM
jgi:hypothetical protein